MTSTTRLHCPTCKKEYKSLSSLRRHYQNHIRDTCPVCDKSFVTSKALKVHIAMEKDKHHEFFSVLVSRKIKRFDKRLAITILKNKP